MYSLKSNTEWTLTQTLQPPAEDGLQNMYFGNGVNTYEEWTVSGAPGYVSSGQQAGFSGADAGVLYVYQLDSSSGLWSQHQRLVPSQNFKNQQFGYSSRVTTNAAGAVWLITGAPSYYYVYSGLYVPIGATFIYELLNDAWTQNALLLSPTSTGPFPLSQSFFGYATSIDGDYAVVGAPLASVSVNSVSYLRMGAAFVYSYSTSSNSWSQIGGQLQSINADQYLGFGASVALHNGYAVVGQTGKPFCSGASCSTYESVQIYTLNGNTVTFEQTLLPGTAGIGYGMSVAINDNYVIVGAPYADSNSGNVYLYELTATAGWSQLAIMYIDDGSGANAQYGYRSSLSTFNDYTNIGAFGYCKCESYGDASMLQIT